MTSLLELDVPATLYGMCLLEPKYLSIKTDGLTIWIVEHFRIWGLLLLNYAVQTLFVFELARSMPSEKMACANSVAILQVTCLFIFEVSMIAEVRECTDLFRLIWSAEKAKNDPLGGPNFMPVDGLDGEGGAIRSAKKEEGIMNKMWKSRKRMYNKQRKAWSLKGTSPCYRLFMFVIVAIPKMALALSLGWIGGRYILGSYDEETLILNTMACEFIVDIDELIYQAFTSPSVQENVDNSDPVVIEINNIDHKIMWISNFMLLSVTFVISTIGVLFFKRQRCETYMFPWEDDSDFRWPWEVRPAPHVAEWSSQYGIRRLLSPIGSHRDL